MATSIPAEVKFAVLAMIYALAFFIRLFAVVKCRANANAYTCVLDRPFMFCFGGGGGWGGWGRGSRSGN